MIPALSGQMPGVALAPAIETVQEEYRDKVSGDEACRSGDYATAASFFRDYRQSAEAKKDRAAVRDAFEREIDAWIRAGVAVEATQVLNNYEQNFAGENSISVALWRADICLLQNKVEQAQALLEPVLSSLPEKDVRRTQALTALASVRERQGRYAEAAELYGKLRENEADPVLARQSRENEILMRIAANDLEKALEILRTSPLANQSPRDLAAQKLLSFYLRLKRDNVSDNLKAEWSELEKTIPEEKDPLLQTACYLIGETFLAGKETLLALTAYRMSYMTCTWLFQERNILNRIIEILEQNGNSAAAANLVIKQFDLFQGRKAAPGLKLRYCTLLITAKQYDSALSIAQSALESLSSRNVQDRMFETIFRQFVEEKAYRHGKRLMDFHWQDAPDDPRYHLTHAGLLYKEGKKLESADLYRTIGGKHEKYRLQADNRAVEIYSELAKYDAVIALCDRILAKNPASPALFHRAIAYSKQNQAKKARKDFLAYTKLPSDTVSKESKALALFSVARLYMEERKVQQAIPVFGEIVRDYAETQYAPASGYWLVHSHLITENGIRAAEQASWNLTEKYPESAYSYSALLRLAAYYRSQGAADRAADVLKQTVSQTRHPAIRARGLYEKALLAYQEGDNELALNTIQELESSYPDDANLSSAIYLRGDIRKKEGQFPAAAGDYLEAAKRRPGSHLEQAAWGAAGDCYFALGTSETDKPENFKKALLYYDHILDLPTALPEYRTMAQYKKAKCLQQSNAPEEEVFAEYRKMLYFVPAEKAQNHPAELFWIIKGLDELEKMAKNRPVGEWINAAVKAVEYKGTAGLLDQESVRKGIRQLRKRKYKPIIQEIHEK